MTVQDHGTLVRKALVPKEYRPIPLYLDGPLKCEWVGIIVYENSEECELVFYDEAGEPREWLFRESITIAQQEGINITAYKHLSWLPCNVTNFTDSGTVKWNTLNAL